jgi:hypothetical protein
MKIVLHIDRLVLDGPGFGPGEPQRIAAALRTELTRLLGQDPIRPHAGVALPRLASSPAVLEPGLPADRVGSRIAASLHGSLGTLR